MQLVSGTIYDAEIKFSPSGKEAIAAISALRKFKIYLFMNRA